MTKVAGEWLAAPGAQKIMALIEDAGHQIYAVGGCVRNDLLGHPVADVDMSTDGLPSEVTDLCKGAGLKVIPTGIEHGTVTVIANGVPYEITTFRADVETDGRRAVVRFSKDIAEDAIRRDFTMNALYADRHGTILDPLGGLPDLYDRRFRFIANANQRIREDYLRTLRYFRFFAWYGDSDKGMDQDALAAIADNLDGLEQLSKERVGMELLKLLSAADPLMSISVMMQVGVLPRLLPRSDVKAMGPLLHMEQQLGLGPDPIRRLAALGPAQSDGLRLSNAQSKKLELLHSLIRSLKTLNDVAYTHGKDIAMSFVALNSAVLEQPLPIDAEAQIDHAINQVFPVSAKDLMPKYQGEALGKALHKLKADWIASGFAIPKDRLLSTLEG